MEYWAARGVLATEGPFGEGELCPSPIRSPSAFCLRVCFWRRWQLCREANPDQRRVHARHEIACVAVSQVPVIL